MAGNHSKKTTTRRQGNRTEEKEHVRPKSLGYLKKLNTAVRDHFANAMTLPTFLETHGTLTLEDRKLLVRQALILIEQNYVHLPLKRAMHSIDPVQRLKLLLQEFEQTPAESLPSEVTFHREMTEIFTSTHDGHTNYMLPAPFSRMTASLPFMVEDYFEAGKRKYLASHIVQGAVSQPTFVEGVEVVFWNGIPIERAALNNARRYSGSNREAQHAHGVRNLTSRALFIALPPDEAWVIVGYRTSTGKLEEVRVDWIVNPALPSGESDGSGKGAKADPQAAAALGLDIEHHHIQQMRKALFAPQVVTAEKKVAEKLARGGELGALESMMPGFFSARPVTTPSGTFGYVRIRDFMYIRSPGYVYTNLEEAIADSKEFVNEFIRLIASLPQNGLIIDVRGNGGGVIWNGEWILQLLTPRRIEPEPVQFINTPLNLRICQQNDWLNQWVESIQQSLQTGAVFSAGFPISNPEECNATGQKYFGPVVLITDAMCYSTTDFFAAGFQDHEIGPILGADGNTGAGGANVWMHDYLRDLMPGKKSVYQPLPNGAGMRVAIRRGLRVGKRAGMPVEDLGVIPDERHFMTKNDLLHDNVDLINRAGELLAAKQPARAFALTLQYLPPQIIDNVVTTQVKVKANTQGMSRLDIYLNDRPLQSIDIQGGQTTFFVTTKNDALLMPTLEISGFDGRELVARYRTSIGGFFVPSTTSKEPGWKFCQRCGGLFFTTITNEAPAPLPTCRGTVDGSGEHDFGVGKPRANQSIPHTLTRVDPWEDVLTDAENDIFNAEVAGANWAYCTNCRGLFHSIGSANENECNHSTAGHVKDAFEVQSGNYRLEAHESIGTAPKNAYYECRHCRGLYNDSMKMACNANTESHIHEEVMGVNNPVYYILH